MISYSDVVSFADVETGELYFGSVDRIKGKSIGVVGYNPLLRHYSSVSRTQSIAFRRKAILSGSEGPFHCTEI